MALNLRIYIYGANQQKAMRFSPDLTIAECIAEIKEKSGIGGADHGLLLPETNGEPAKWLKPNYTLSFYNLTDGVR